MKTVLLRVSAAALALALLAAVVYLGILSGRDNHFVVWFGIASAIAAPIGLSLIGYALHTSKDDLVERLSKVPELERLMAEAKTQEDRLHLLEAEHARLTEIVRVEARRQAIQDRRDTLEHDAVRILGELRMLDAEAGALDDSVSQSSAREEIQSLHERVRAREGNDLILRLGTRVYRIDADIIAAIPFGLGHLVRLYVRLVETMLSWVRRR